MAERTHPAARGAGLLALVSGGLVVSSLPGAQAQIGNPGSPGPAPAPAPIKPGQRGPRMPVQPPSKGAPGVPAPMRPGTRGPRLPVQPPEKGGPPAATAKVLPAVPPPGDQFMPVSEVRPGMKGYGLTVWHGTKLERFDVEVLGVLPKINVGQPLVLVKLSGGPISQRGAYLVQGMSGSPIYINGKLLGAFSQGDAWPKEPIGMVTPIEQMMEALDPKLSSVPAGGETAFDWNAPAQIAASLTGEPGTGLFRPADIPSVSALGRTFRPLALPVMVSGMSGRNIDRVAQALAPYNLAVMQGPGSMEQPFKAELTPGQALGISLVTGDVDMTAIGTVTYRKGDDLLAFGHPWMQIGAAQWPITTAWIHDVFPGLQVSHKYGSAGEIVGTMTQDRPYSVAGKVGPVPKMIPVHYTVKDQSTGRSKTFNCQVVNHPLLVGQLLPIAVNSGLYEIRPVPGDAIARVKMTVQTDGAGDITRENVFFDPSMIDVAAVREIQELLGLLSANAFKRVPVKSLDVSVTLEEKRPTASVERVFLAQDKFEPGDEVPVGIVVRPYRKDPVVLRAKVKVPESATNGRAILMVQGGATRINLAPLLSGSPSGSMMPSPAPPDASLKQAVRRFTEREHNDQVVVRLIFPTSAVNVSGQRLSQLPAAMVDIMRSSKTTGFRIERDEVHSQQNTDYVVDGLQTLDVTIEKKDHLEKPKTGTLTPGAPSSSGSFTPPPPSGRTNLRAADDDDLLRFTVDGQLRTIRLSPEDEEKEEKKPKNDRKSRKDKPADDKSGAKKPADDKAGAKPGEKDGKADDKEGKDGDKESSIPRPGSLRPTPPPPAAPDDKLVGRAAVAWSQTASTDFERGTLENVAVNSSGDVRLAPGLKLAEETSEQFIWSIIGANGSLYAGTGNGGQVIKLDKDQKAQVALKTGELEVHALAKDASGNVYAGTSPNGKLFRIAPDGKTAELYSMNGDAPAAEAGVKYILSLAVGPDGTLYAGTGPEGKILRLPAGKSAVETVCALPTKSVTSVIVGADGALYAGTAEEGAIYRVRPDGGSDAAKILYDTDQTAITGLAMDASGNLYAATAPSGQVYKIEPDGTPRVHFDKARGALYGLLLDAQGNLYSGSGSSVVRIEADGSATVLTDKRNGQFTCIAWDDEGHLVAGSSNVGSIYRLTAAASGTFESTVHDAKLPARWGRLRYTGVLPNGGSIKVQTRSGDTAEPDATWSEWQDPAQKDGGQFVASPPARFLQYRVVFQAADGAPSLRDMTVYYLPRNRAPKLTLASPTPGEVVHGSYGLKWTATDPDNDTLTYEMAYSSDGGKTWKPVGEKAAEAPGPRAAASLAGSRTTRADALAALEQFKQKLDADTSKTPTQREEEYKQAKALIDQYLKDAPGAQAEPAQPGKPEEKPGEKPGEKTEEKPAPASNRPAGVTRQASFNWDTRQVPDGIYLLRVIATDRAANPGDAQVDVRISEPFIVANTPPNLMLSDKDVTVDAGRNASLRGIVMGRVSLKGAQYRLGDGDWNAIDPEDGIWDSSVEAFRFSVVLPAAGNHEIEVKAVDSAGNVQTTKLKVTAP